MPFSLNYACQGANKNPSVNSAGDYQSISTSVLHGTTRITTQAVKPSALTELIIDADCACTVNLGAETALTLPAGGLYVWSDKSGVPCYFESTDFEPFVIANTEGSSTKEVRVAYKSTEAELD